MIDIDEKVLFGRLFAFYGNLLTDKQREIFDCFFYEDYNLTEIGDRFGVSKQAVRDILTRTCDRLRDLERSLGLLAQFERMHNICESAMQALDKGELDAVRSDLALLSSILEE